MKYIAYYRTSTSRQNLGIQAQAHDVNTYVQKVNGELIATYTEQESGKDNNRTELAKALTACKKENAILVIAKLDRLSRNVAFLFSLKNAGINFIALDMPNCNTLTLAIYSGLAQQERELISERTKKALQVKKAHGYKLGAPHPHFTTEDRAKSLSTRQIIAKENENNKRAMAIVKEMLKTNSNYSQIARYLNDGGFKTARGCEFRDVQVKRIAIQIDNEGK